MRRRPARGEWDVKRLAASLEVAGRGNGFGGKDRREIVTATVASYRQAMRSFAAMTNLDVWYAHADVEQLQRSFRLRRRSGSARWWTRAWPRRGPVTACRKSPS